MERVLTDAIHQVWRLRRTYGLVLLGTGAVLFSVSVAAATTDISLTALMRDPLGVVDANPLTGFLSNLGIALWSASAGVCGLATLAMRRACLTGLAAFFFWSTVLTAVLTLDDLYQVHEEVVPYVLGRGQRAMALGYVALVAVFVWRYRRTLLAFDYTFLLGAGVGFAVSIGVDLIPHALWSESMEPLFRLAEDGSKFLGIVLWLTFFLRAGSAAVARVGVAGSPSNLADNSSGSG